MLGRRRKFSRTSASATIPRVVQKWHFNYTYVYIHLRDCKRGHANVLVVYLASREPLPLLVKIHLITEHYRTEGVMIATLARNRNCSARTNEKRSPLRFRASYHHSSRFHCNSLGLDLLLQP